MATVQLQDVRKVYENGYVAVHGADIDIADGEFVVLVGPSGCGKSTTLRMIAGLESISGGTLRIGDRVVNDVPPKERDIAMVFQNYALYPHMTVAENMAFGLKLRKMDKAEIQKRVAHAAEILGIEPILDRKPKQLSGGQRQRVAVGRAIVRDPQVFLFDEPLSNLDAKLRVQMRREIASLHRRLRATMIYVTHDQVEAMTMGDRIVVLKDGHVQQAAPPLELYNHPVNRFVAGFIGSPAMNFIEGHVAREDGLLFVSDDADIRLPLIDGVAEELADHVGETVTLGVRPEDVYVVDEGHDVGAHGHIHMEIEGLEPMGNEIVLYAQAGTDVHLVARVAPQPLPGPGAPIHLAFDQDKLHFFDGTSGLALRTARVAAV